MWSIEVMLRETLNEKNGNSKTHAPCILACRIITYTIREVTHLLSVTYMHACMHVCMHTVCNKNRKLVNKAKHAC